MSIQATEADPLYGERGAERPAYATGMLLDAQDFTDEQTYHRGRLARALAFLAGGGTLAGLAVEHVAGSETQAEQIRVRPGLAVDRLGRLVELPRSACLRLPRWFEREQSLDGGDTLRRAAYGDLGRFVSPRMARAATVLPARAVVADVYLRFAACKVGLTPSFAAGPFDALNAVSTSRLRDAYELQLVPRDGLDDDFDGLPQRPGAPVVGDASADADARRDAVQDAVLDGYPVSGSGELAALPEHPPGMDRSAVFIARVFIPVGEGTPPERSADAPLVDNWSRRFLPPLGLVGQWLGA
jgi:hypothetical protein